jgi:Mrr restriction endonuclease-like protein
MAVACRCASAQSGGVAAQPRAASYCLGGRLRLRPDLPGPRWPSISTCPRVTVSRPDSPPSLGTQRARPDLRGIAQVSHGRYSHFVPLTPQSDLRDLLVVALGSLGGKARRRDVLDEMNRLFSGVLTAADRESPRTHPNEEKWRNRASYERADMVREGLLVNRADGIWELASRGRALLNRLPIPAGYGALARTDALAGSRRTRSAVASRPVRRR